MITLRFWLAYIGGAYATHGEALDTRWISGGGKLIGASPQRITFLKKLIEEAPGGIRPLDPYYIMNLVGKYGSYYLYYFSDEKPKTWAFVLPDDELKKGMKFKADVIDTWNMTVTPVAGEFEIDSVGRYNALDKKRSVITLPGKPYMALLIRRSDDAALQSKGKKRNELTDEE